MLKSGQLALTGNVKVAQTWRRGVGIGNPGSNVLAVHACHYACDKKDATYWRLGQAEIGDKIIHRSGDIKAVCSVDKVMSNVKNRPKRFWSNMYEWSGPRRVYFAMCSQPDGHGHYKAKIVVRGLCSAPKVVAAA